MSVPEVTTGRVAQRRRTRAAIVAAAADLLRDGADPSVNDIAHAADVSRRTVYEHFPTLEQLLTDATLGLLSQARVDEAIDAADTDRDPGERVAAMVRALCDMSGETLGLGRSLLRLTVASPPADNSVPRRGYRRVEWIERAVEPLRAELTPATYRRLVSSLAVVVGWEALIVLQDLRALPAEEQAETSLWAARALIEAALRER
jgi:AcrR family transcriptional regulator